jgi:hypothetical protein
MKNCGQAQDAKRPKMVAVLALRDRLSTTTTTAVQCEHAPGPTAKTFVKSNAKQNGFYFN